LDPRAHIGQLACGLEKRDAVSCVCERVRCGEAADACADDDGNVEAEAGAAATFLKGMPMSNFAGMLGWCCIVEASGRKKKVS